MKVILGVLFCTVAVTALTDIEEWKNFKVKFFFKKPLFYIYGSFFIEFIQKILPKPSRRKFPLQSICK